MLNNVTYNVGLDWRKFIPKEIVNCWNKCAGNDNFTWDNMKLAAFSEHELKTTSNALRSNLGANDLTI
jgi:hypothetical protein